MSGTDVVGTGPSTLGDWSITRRTSESTIGLGMFTAAVVVLAALPWWDTDGSLRTRLTVVLYYLALAQMWNLLAGYAGLVSIGQQMFVGSGIYTLLTLAEDSGLDPFLSVPLAGLVAALLSIPTGFVAFRLRGGYFAIGTWVLAEAIRLITLEIGPLDAGNVRSLTRRSLGGYETSTRNNLVYWAALFLAAGATLIVVFTLRSRLGLALRAVRDNESGAQSLGVDVSRTKFIVWVLCAFWTGMVGAVILLNVVSVRADSAYSVLNWTALVIFIVVIGGAGSPTGPIIGVVVYWVLDELFADAETWRFIILGLVAAAMATLAPRGIDGLIRSRREFEPFPVQRRLIDRSEP